MIWPRRCILEIEELKPTGPSRIDYPGNGPEVPGIWLRLSDRDTKTAEIFKGRLIRSDREGIGMS